MTCNIGCKMSCKTGPKSIPQGFIFGNFWPRLPKLQKSIPPGLHFGRFLARAAEIAKIDPPRPNPRTVGLKTQLTQTLEQCGLRHNLTQTLEQCGLRRNRPQPPRTVGLRMHPFSLIKFGKQSCWHSGFKSLIFHFQLLCFQITVLVCFVFQLSCSTVLFSSF